MIFSSHVRAQNVDFGLTAGFQFAFWGANDIYNSLGRLGFVAGGHASVFINNRFVVKPALLFSQKGTWFANVDGQNDGDTYALTSDYVSIPILAKWYITKGLHAQAGPQLSYLLTSKSKQGGEVQADLKERGYVKPIDVGIVFGLGYEFRSTFTIGMNFDVSFIDLIDNREGFENHVRNELRWIENRSFPKDLHNTALQFTFSYNFTKNRSAF